MVEHEDASFVAECFWPGVAADDLDALDQRVRKAVADLARGGSHVRYLGSILMAEDEVVLCQFEGTAAAVREAAERAQIPFERIVEAFRPSTRTADPTERQIAQLAADGLTNKGIAARMFVSAKTVEANLSRVYRKLGISARTQLGRALAEAQPPRS